MRRAQCLELEVYTLRRLLSILFYRRLAYTMSICLYTEWNRREEKKRNIIHVASSCLHPVPPSAEQIHTEHILRFSVGLHDRAVAVVGDATLLLVAAGICTAYVGFVRMRANTL